MNVKAAAVAVAAATLAASALPALADTHGTTVTTAAVGTESRQLRVLDLAGNDLSSLRLQNGVPQPFHVQVADQNVPGMDPGFTVSAVMNNLYQVAGSGFDYTTVVPSSDLSLGFAATPLTANGVSLTDVPTVLLNGSLLACTDSGLDSALGLTATALVTAAPLLCATGGPLALAPVAVSSLSVPSTLSGAASNLSGLNELFAVAGASSGTFANPNYTDGIGANDTTPAATTARAATDHGVGTQLGVLDGSPLGATSALLGTLGLGSVPSTVVSADGSGALTSAQDVLSAMEASSDTTLQTIAQDFASEVNLGALTGAQVATWLNFIGGVLNDGLSNITELAGSYNAWPTLGVTLPPGLASGTYSGTLTVTMVQQ